MEYKVEVVIPAGAVMVELPNLPDGILDVDDGAAVMLAPDDDEAWSKTPPGVEVTLGALEPEPDPEPDPVPALLEALAEAVAVVCTPGIPFTPVEVGEERQIVGRAALK